MQMPVKSSPKHIFQYENNILKVIDTEMNREHEVAEIMYVPNEQLFMINVNGAFMFSFYLDDDTAIWLDGKTEIRIYSE
jgi:hypothetical protein